MTLIRALSDQHGHLPAIEPCDILVIAGDIVPLEVQDDRTLSARWLDRPFREWLECVPAQEVVGVAGNHDLVFLHPEFVPELPWTYLQDSDAEVLGLRCYGSPWTTPFGGWAFEANDFPELEIIFGQIPEDTDVLVTHMPPLGYGDAVLDFDPHHGHKRSRRGSASLLHAIEATAPKLAVFGHIHEARGRWTLADSGTELANVSLLDDRYKPAHQPMEFTL